MDDAEMNFAQGKILQYPNVGAPELPSNVNVSLVIKMTF